MSIDRSQIPGWGADLDRNKRPAVPMERKPNRLENVHWDTPSLQPQTVEVLHSIERPGVTPVFGSACPPSGLSGAIRRSAFKHSENDMRHWMMLLLADRVNVVEGMVDDVRKSPRAMTAVALGVVAVSAVLLARRNRQPEVPELTDQQLPPI